MADLDECSLPSLPVLAGRYPKRRTASESYSPGPGDYGRRKRAAQLTPEKPGTATGSDDETLPSPSCQPGLVAGHVASDEKRVASSPHPPPVATPTNPCSSSSFSSSVSSSRSGGWKVGDHCLALYEEDSDYYEAVILRLRTRKRRQTAEVVFVGYEEDGHSVVDLDTIRPLTESPVSPKCTKVTPMASPAVAVPSNRMFSHSTSVDQHDNYMKSRYGEFSIPDDDDTMESSLTSAVDDKPAKVKKSPSLAKLTSPGTDKGKSVVVAEVALTSNKTTPKRSASSSTTTPKTTVTPTTPACHVPLRSAGSPSLHQFESWEPDGFSEDDLEKPKFQKAAGSAKVSFVLSDPTVQPSVAIPAPLNQYLRDYQRHGAKFLFEHFHQRKGCVLGDDMGLGKTVQVIAFMTAVLGKSNTKLDVQPRFQRTRRQTDQENDRYASGVFLVVTPASVLYNWEDEIKTWTHLKSRVLHGSQRTETMELARQGGVDVVLTTYETARLNLDFVNSIDWLAGVFDEAHKMKDPTSQTTQCMKGLRLRRRIGLTGTAMQNSLTELWCLLDWCNPGCLGRKDEFEEDVALPMMTGQRLDSTKRELATGRQKQKQLQEELGKWFLRRTKALIADELPKKEEFVVFCPWTSLQYSICQALLECDEFQLVLKAHDPCPCGSGRQRSRCCYSANSEGLDWKKLILPYLSLMMKAACHLGLLLPENTDSANQKSKASAICTQVFSKHRKFLTMSREAAFLTLSDKEYCGKMQVLEKLLRRVKSEGSRVLLFSFRTKILNLLQTFLQQQGYTFCRLDGSVSMKQRTVLVRSFNTDPGIFVFLASKSVGGVGLNIIGANVVIIFDPDWNPATDSQAQDRAYRLGQHRDVQVYRFITQGSVEENAYLRQVYKQQMTNMAVGGEIQRRHFTAVMGLKGRERRGHIKGELFSFENMFTIRQESSCMTEDILKRTARIEHGILLAKDEVSPFPSGAPEEVDEKEGTPEKPVEAETDLLKELSQTVQEEERTEGRVRTSPRKSGRSAVVRADTEEPLVDGGYVFQDDMAVTDVTGTSRSRKVSLLHDTHNARRRHEGPRTKAATTSAGTDEQCDGPSHIQPQAKSPSPPRLRRGRSSRESLSFKAKKRLQPSPSFGDVAEVADPGMSDVVGAKTISAVDLLVGTSRAERRMSRHAMRDVFDRNQLSQQPANCIADESSEESDDLGERTRLQEKYRPTRTITKRSPEHKSDNNADATIATIADSTIADEYHAKSSDRQCMDRRRHGRHHQSVGAVKSPDTSSSLVVVGHTPPAIRLQHFQRLSELVGHGNIMEFARTIAESTPEQRRTWLEMLYAQKKCDRIAAGQSDVQGKQAAEHQNTAVGGIGAVDGNQGTKSTAVASPLRSPLPAGCENGTTQLPIHGGDVLVEDSCGSLSDISAVMSPVRRRQQFKKPVSKTRAHAELARTVIPESDSLGLRGGCESLLSEARQATLHSSKPPDAEVTLATILDNESSVAAARHGAGGKRDSPPDITTTAEATGVCLGKDQPASNLSSHGHSATAAATAVVDHDLELADLLFG